MRTLAGTLGLCLLALGSAAEEPIEGWLPEETLFCLSVENPSRTAARLAGGRYAAVRGDPAAQRLAVEAKAFLAAARETTTARGEVWLGAFWELARGPILLAVVPARDGPAPLVVIDVGEAAAFRGHLARLADTGVLGPEAERDGIRARHGGEGGGAVYWIERGSVVAFSWRETAVVAAARRMRDGSSGLAPRLAAVRGKLRADADAILYLPREALKELEDRSTDVASLSLPDEVALGLAITLDPDALDVRAFLFAPRPRRGVLALLDGPNVELDPPPFLAAEGFLAARVDLRGLPRFARETLDADEARELERLMDRDAGRLATSFLGAVGDRFALAQVGGEQVFLAKVEREAWMRRLLSAFPGEGGVREGPDGAVALRDGWLIAAARADPVRQLLSEPRAPWAATDALPGRRIAVWRLAPEARRTWDDPMRLFAGQEGALVNDPDGLLLVHRVLLR